MSEVLVLGAGILGVNSAYWLAKAGHDVRVIDRQPLPGQETSFANGGQISVSHAEPWANPSAPFKVLYWLLKGDSPLLFRPRLDPHQWRWLLSWLWQCRPSACRHNTLEIVRLALYSRGLLQQVRSEHQLEYEQQTRGILHLYRNQQDFEDAKPVTRMMQQYGCDRQIINKQQVIDLEPALQATANEIVGGTYTATDESGNAQLYCQELTNVCRKMGVLFDFDLPIKSLSCKNGKVHVQVAYPDLVQSLSAKHIVMALGSWSAPMLRSIGIYPNIYPAKGYSVTIPIQNLSAAPSLSLTDDEFKIVYTRLGNNLRIAGTAELSGYDDSINQLRCEALVKQTQHLFPDLGGFDQGEFWAGLRPATPSNLPYIGATRYSNLWLNTGHGTLGWTMGCGSGKLIADMICSHNRSRINQGYKAFLPAS